MARGAKTGGRQKGSLNKTTKAVKDVIAEAADTLGGVDRLVSWAREDVLNERAFWSTIYPKLLPLQMDANLTHEVGNSIKSLMEQLNGRTRGIPSGS